MSSQKNFSLPAETGFSPVRSPQAESSTQLSHPCTLPLEFHRHIFEELLSEDGLLVLSRGLGLRRIICALLKIYSDKESLVILLNANGNELNFIKEELAECGVKKPGLRVVNNETNSKERSELYISGGILSITSRILIIDLLQKRIPSYLITGILVMHAERVNETSTEAFILRIFKEENKEGFIKAFSDSPESFISSGLSPLQTTLQLLQLRKVFIYPRFHVMVRDCLEQRKADVTELYQPLSPSMNEIQQAITECIEACLSEIKKGNGNLLNVDDLSVENSFFRSFDVIIKRQLEPVWHRVSSKTKLIVNDLTTLRKLLEYLVSYDCVSFNSFLETIITSQTPTSALSQQQQSPWLSLDAGNTIFSVAKGRVFIRTSTTNPTDNTQKNSYSASKLPPGIQPVLEELPKWNLLAETLDEIESDITSHTTETSRASYEGKDLSRLNNTVLIMVENERECSQLREYLSTIHIAERQGVSKGSIMLERLLKNYFKWKSGMSKVSKNLFNGNDKEKCKEVNSNNGKDEQLKRGTFQRGQQPPNKRRRVRGGSSTATTSAVSTRKLKAKILEEEAQEIANFINSNQTIISEASTVSSATISSNNDPSTSCYDDEFDVEAFSTYFGLLDLRDLIIVRPISGDEDDRILQSVKPKYIVVYHPDQAFVRRVEVYRALHPDIPCKVFFMMYENSIEEQKYLSAIRKEKDAFEKLIREKSIMAIPLGRPLRIFNNQHESLINTRIAGGRITQQIKEPKIIIDVREFRSSLPSLLHQSGIEILPCTLTIGDYILSPNLCVERKSISDLIGSFNSGRLYAQCEAMSIHYKQPILLIEFDKNQSFTLQSINEFRPDIGMNDISSKLVLLTKTFPRLKIIWSSNPIATVEIFQDLKKLEEEPNLEIAQMIGLDDGEIDDSLITNNAIESDYNLVPQEFLRSLPGVTSKNYKYIMTKVENLKELSQLSKNEMQNMIGNDDGNKLFEFFNKDVKEEKK
ncbi:DNA repair protein [Rhizophagus clarus]|uniref:DNA repair protein n=1 Tax=Rhizophagus clarus TaxID=94130 RepID=A0A8H3L2L2_9GLOM|nr:DNA repair protein [Rhizophagus clarus]